MAWTRTTVIFIQILRLLRSLTNYFVPKYYGSDSQFTYCHCSVLHFLLTWIICCLIYILKFTFIHPLTVLSSSALGDPYIWSLSRVWSRHLHGHNRRRLQRNVLLWWILTSGKHDLTGVTLERCYIGHAGNVSNVLCIYSGLRCRRTWWITCLCGVITTTLSWCEGIFSV